MERYLILASGAVAPRREVHNGRPHLVVPVVAAVEGVWHVSNSKDAELVRAAEFLRDVAQWDGAPIFHGHPTKNGAPIAASQHPELLMTDAFGSVRNPSGTDNRLAMEAWLDEELTKARAGALYDRVVAGDPIEISVGVFVDADKTKSGELNGRKYAGEWTNIRRDHLALLPKGEIGACSREKGCGVRHASEWHVEDDFRAADNPTGINQYTSGGRSAREHGEAAAAHERAAMANRAAYKSGVVASPEGARLSEVAQKASREAASASKGAPVGHRSVYAGAATSVAVKNAEHGTQGSHGSAARAHDVAAAEHHAMAQFHNRTKNASEKQIDKSGASIFAQMMEIVREMFSDEVVSEVKNAAAKGEPQDHNQPVEESGNMELKDRVKALIGKFAARGVKVEEKVFEAATECQVAELEKLAEPAQATDAQVKAATDAIVTKAQADVKAATDRAEKAEAELKAVKDASAKVPTLQEYIAGAPAEVRPVIEAGIKAAKDRKDATIKQLKASGRCKFSDAQLEAKDQIELDQLVELTGVKVAVDFSAQGGPRVPETEEKDVPAPPDMFAAVRAARGQK